MPLCLILCIKLPFWPLGVSTNRGDRIALFTHSAPPPRRSATPWPVGVDRCDAHLARDIRRSRKCCRLPDVLGQILGAVFWFWMIRFWWSDLDDQILMIRFGWSDFDDQILMIRFWDQILMIFHDLSQPSQPSQPSQHEKNQELRPLTLDGLCLCGRIPPGSWIPVNEMLGHNFQRQKKIKKDDSSRFYHDFELHIWPWSTRMHIFETSFVILKQIKDACVFFKCYFSSISDQIRCISDRFQQTSPKSSVNRDVAVFWLHCYFWYADRDSWGIATADVPGAPDVPLEPHQGSIRKMWLAAWRLRPSPGTAWLWDIVAGHLHTSSYI